MTKQKLEPILFFLPIFPAIYRKQPYMYIIYLKDDAGFVRDSISEPLLDQPSSYYYFFLNKWIN